MLVRRFAYPLYVYFLFKSSYTSQFTCEISITIPGSHIKSKSITYIVRHECCNDERVLLLICLEFTGRDIVTSTPGQGARDRKLYAVHASSATFGSENKLFADHDASGRE